MDQLIPDEPVSPSSSLTESFITIIRTTTTTTTTTIAPTVTITIAIPPPSISADPHNATNSNLIRGSPHLHRRSKPLTTGTHAVFRGLLDCVSQRNLCDFSLVAIGIAAGIIISASWVGWRIYQLQHPKKAAFSIKRKPVPSKLERLYGR